jgi:hypothetical protein
LNYIAELYDLTNQPENLEVKNEEEVIEDKNDPYILYTAVEKASKRWGIRRLPGMVMYLGMYS